MGLGKTVQIIAFLSVMLDASLVEHLLVIMPTILISTWVREFTNWTSGMRVKTFHSLSKDKIPKASDRFSKEWHHYYCKVLPNKDHTTCGKERFSNPDCRAVTLFGFRVR
jgi:SNF2 family DNA or RNA helicase